jgi:thiamine pyrophosphokinase
MHTTVVFTGGPPPTPGVAADLRRALSLALPDGADLAVAADGGLALSDAVGRPVDLVVGDLDSVDPEQLAAAVAAGSRVQRHPVDKDLTDLELALAAAEAAAGDDPARVVVAGSDGGRLDHLLAVVGVLAAPRWSGVEAEALLGPARVVPVRGTRRIPGRPGELVSLLAVHGVARGVRTSGLQWALAGEDLQPGSGRGVSNRLVDDEAVVEVRDGCVLVVLPGSEEER